MKKIINFLNISALLALMLGSINVFGQGDNCMMAEDISFAFDNAFGDPCNYQVEGPYSNSGATIDADAANFDETWTASTGTMSCCACESENSGDADVDNPVWFSFTPANTGNYSIFALGDESSQNGCTAVFGPPGDDDTQFWIFTGSCGNLSLYDCNEDSDAAVFFEAGGTFNFTAGTTYYLVVDGYLGSQGNFCLEIANDTGTCVNCGDGICGLGFGETYCGCSSECPCDLVNGFFLEYDDTNPDAPWGGTILGTADVVYCPDYLTTLGVQGVEEGNVYIGYGFFDVVDLDDDGTDGDCANTPITEVTITYDVGTLTDFAGNAIPTGTLIPTSFVLFFELTPADVAAGGISLEVCLDDGIGGQCCVPKFITFDPNLTPGVTDPYCPCAAGSITDAAVLDQNVCFDSTINLCTDGNEDLTLECPAGFTYQYAWKVLGESYGQITDLTNWVLAPPCGDVDVNTLFIDEFGYVPPFTPGAPLTPGITYFIQGGAVCVDGNGNLDMFCAAADTIFATLLPAGDPLCITDIVGCTDPCDPNYDMDATVNDPTLCAGYPTDCNADCTQGPIGGTWDPATCACINETTPVLGCTDAAFCEFDPAADCDDSSCATPNTDPGCDDGDCTNGVETWDMASCACVPGVPPVDPGCDDGDCTNGLEIWDGCECVPGAPPVLGCTDSAACNFEPAADCDNNSCDFGNTACPDPCNEPDPDDGCDLTTDTFDAATCMVTNEPNCPAGETFNPANCMCVMDEVDGCTDPCDPAFNPDSTNDLLCEGYNTDCNADCTAGPFGGVWDSAACACANETTPVDGCTDMGATNYDPAANCDDGTCIIEMCDDPCAPNFGAAEACEDYNSTCNDDCTVGPFGGTWDDVNCVCIDETDPVDGCTDSTASNYDPAANCDDGSCEAGCPAEAATIAGGPFEFCVADGTPDFVSGITVDGGAGTNAAWVITDDQLNILGLPGMPGEVDFDGAALGTCLIWYVTFEDITGAEVGMNAGDLTGCFALSNSIEVVREDCTCEDEISGSIEAAAGCDVSGTAVLITDAAGNGLGMAIADANGDYVLPGGPYTCGEYIATIDVASVPACYTDAGGDVGPAGFTVNGDGTADGANFSAFDEVPTLSQWGLMTLALLLMTFGALKLGFVNNIQTSTNRRK